MYIDSTKVILRLRRHILGGGRSIVARAERRLCIRLYRLLLHLKGSELPIVAQIGEGVTFPHGITGIFISQGAVIGDGCTIFQQVTIGSNTLADSARCGAPRLGNNVYVGAGAKIIGAVTVGNNVRIGANACVAEDIPDNATVVMARPRIILHDSARDNTFTAWHKPRVQG